jgi:hypothetical protein
MTRFQPILEIFWRNKKIDLSVLVHERLKNPTDTLSNTIKLFNYQNEQFNMNLPISMDIGLLHLDSKATKDTLTPFPKKMIA